MKPDAIYRRLGSTLGEAHWPSAVPFAKGFGIADVMEWLVSGGSSIRVTGVMFRELARSIDEDLYGSIAASFSPILADGGGSDPEFQWTEWISASYT